MKIDFCSKLVLLLISFSLLLNSCSLGLGAMTSLDNNLNESWNLINDINKVESGSKLKIVLSDSSQFIGEYVANELIFDSQKALIKIELENDSIKYVSQNNIARMEFIKPNNGFWSGFKFGVVIDVLLIIGIIALSTGDGFNPEIELF